MTSRRTGTTDPWDSRTPVLGETQYRPDIDGLRAVSVLCIMGFHAFPHIVRGGFVGVDIFFAISGYLITAILLREVHSGRIDYAGFYARRIRRIFPALAVVLLSVFFAAWYVLLSDEYRRLGRHLAAGAGFLSNFSLWSESGYFDQVTDTKPLRHLWSLAIEEQFYVVWPLFLSLLILVGTGRAAWVALAVIVGCSFGFNFVASHRDPIEAFYSPLARVWELAAGGLLALAVAGRARTSPRASPVKAVAGCLLLAASLVLIDDDRRYLGAWMALPVCGTLLIIAAGSTPWPNRMLSHRALVWIGLISYPLYLWHWPLVSFTRLVLDREPSPVAHVVVASVGIALAMATYRYVEQPIRHRRGRGVVVGLSTSMAVCLLLGGLAWAQVVRPRNSSPDLDAYLAAIADAERPPGLEGYGINNRIVRISERGDRTIFFWGDSHMEQYTPRLAELAAREAMRDRSISLAVSGGCPPIPNVFDDAHGACEPLRNLALDYALGSNVSAIVIGACWNCYFIDQTQPVDTEATTGNDAEKPYEYYFLENGTKLLFRGGPGRQHALVSLEALLRRLSPVKQVYLLLDNPRGDAFDPRTYIEGSRLGTMRVRRGETRIAFDAAQQLLRGELIDIARRAGVAVIDPVETLCSDGLCTALASDGRPIYQDTSHLRGAFVKHKVTYLDEVVLNAGK